MYFTAFISILFFCTSIAMPNGNRNGKINLNLSLGPPKIDLNLSLGPPKIDLNLSLGPPKIASSSQQNANNQENMSNIQTRQTNAQKFAPNCAKTLNTFGRHENQTVIAFDRTCNSVKQIIQLSLSFLGLSLNLNPCSLTMSSSDLFQKIENNGMSSFGDKILAWIQENFEDGTLNRQIFDEMAQRIRKGIALFNDQFDLHVKFLQTKKKHRDNSFVDLKSILQHYYFYYRLYHNLLYELCKGNENGNERPLLSRWLITINEVLVSRMATISSKHGFAMDKIVPIIRMPNYQKL